MSAYDSFRKAADLIAARNASLEANRDLLGRRYGIQPPTGDLERISAAIGAEVKCEGGRVHEAMCGLLATTRMVPLSTVTVCVLWHAVDRPADFLAYAGRKEAAFDSYAPRLARVTARTVSSRSPQEEVGGLDISTFEDRHVADPDDLWAFVAELALGDPT